MFLLQARRPFPPGRLPVRFAMSPRRPLRRLRPRHPPPRLVRAPIRPKRSGRPTLRCSRRRSSCGSRSASSGGWRCGRSGRGGSSLSSSHSCSQSPVSVSRERCAGAEANCQQVVLFYCVLFMEWDRGPTPFDGVCISFLFLLVPFLFYIQSYQISDLAAPCVALGHPRDSAERSPAAGERLGRQE